ncbi:hypothetical protein AGABI1DRAFT_104924 [Agaricus bisporus var. burnettii JB137-S8]|uniref:Uncharacterized protein n=1 Tax=Agaricus bisporus var. burnettii (strain JB137-S8 / ATCC MYA-4627 / FGSC 10392) TaxID=597362 RepID=K5XIR5_AGABU|nr:uncharacterized protein AGABI1DRAFT_104924 [Agaricus bisporus var. burnettii JB137-S8]EKM83207.1 hypothetical protein AGABI1DRAFT_104924 [Agaricus bisporus var. burnettii JB137-S8]
MSEVHNCGVGFEKQYSLPGVEPPRALATTFSAQRYDPLHLPPTLLLGNGAREQMFRDVQEMVVAEISPTLVSSLAPSPPRAINLDHPSMQLSPNITRLDNDVSISRRRETRLQKVHDSYKNAGKRVRLIWRGVFTCLLASGTTFHHVGRCFRDAIMRVVRSLIGVVRGAIPERAASVTRVALH